MSFSTAAGNFLYRHAFSIYRPLYGIFKNIQDRHEMALLARLVAPGDTILDVGANIGYYAAKLSRLAGPTGTVHCFEPHPANFSRLSQAKMPFANVILNRLAVAGEGGEITFYTSHELNVDHRAYKPEKYESEIRVNAIRLDDYVRDKQIKNVALIKMDIQGFELHALRGMQETIRSNAGIVLLSEFWPYGLQTAGASAMEYFRALEDAGLTVYLAGKELTRLTPGQVERMENAGKAYYNILATKKRV